MPTPIENIGQIAIRARDLPASVAFYRDTLGLDFLFDAGTLAFLMCGDVRLMLAVPENDAGRPPELDRLLPRPRPAGRLQRARRSRRRVRRRAAPDREAPRPRAVDGVLPRPRRQPHRADERGQGAEDGGELEPAVERDGHAHESGVGLARRGVRLRAPRRRARCRRSQARPARPCRARARTAPRSPPSRRRERQRRTRPRARGSVSKASPSTSSAHSLESRLGDVRAPRRRTSPDRSRATTTLPPRMRAAAASQIAE